MINDYLYWRGDLSFIKDPLNDVDTLILSMLSYLPFTGIVPGIESNGRISLQDTSTQFFSMLQSNNSESVNIKPTISSSFNSELLELLSKTANCPRFKNIQLSRYDENTDFVKGEQFAAVTYTLPTARREKIVSFRGTDNSLIGWKEDLEIACMEKTPAQDSAREYLESVIGLFSSKVTVCGHSKGGNLAVYAGAHLSSLRQNKLSGIINFDGPGFDFSIVPYEPFLSSENIVTNYIPEESIVGMLLEPVGRRTVVTSSSRGILQHNALTWKINQSEFIQGEISRTTELLEHTLKSWLTELPVHKRKIFIEALFDILGASEGKTADPIDQIKETRDILIKYSKLDNKTKSLLTEVFLSLTAKTRDSLSATIKENLPRII